MSDFAEKLAVLCSSELPLASRDPDRMGAMIERLAASLGLTIAVAANGDAAQIDHMIAGAEGYAHREAVAKSELARFMAKCRGARP